MAQLEQKTEYAEWAIAVAWLAFIIVMFWPAQAAVMKKMS